MNIIYVALGGALGAVARYGIGLLAGSKWSGTFPISTLLINVSGSFVLGLLNVFVLERTVLSPEWRMALGVGFLGAYTTFSTFTYEIIVLLEEGSYATAGAYSSASLIFGVGAAFLGMALARIL